MTLTKGKIAVIALVVVLGGASSFVVANKVSPLSLKLWGESNYDHGLALKGFDAVSYQSGETPTKGETQYSSEWNGAKWLFSRAENRDRFIAQPLRYAPQFGGYCSLAVANGATADVSTDAYLVRDDKLYLFMDKQVKADCLRSACIKNAQARWH